MRCSYGKRVSDDCNYRNMNFPFVNWAWGAKIKREAEARNKKHALQMAEIRIDDIARTIPAWHEALLDYEAKQKSFEVDLENVGLYKKYMDLRIAAQKYVLLTAHKENLTKKCNCVCHQYGKKIKKGYCCECPSADIDQI